MEDERIRRVEECVLKKGREIKEREYYGKRGCKEAVLGAAHTKGITLNLPILRYLPDVT